MIGPISFLAIGTAVPFKETASIKKWLTNIYLRDPMIVKVTDSFHCSPFSTMIENGFFFIKKN